MNIREQAFNVIASNPELYREWHNCLDEFDRANMLIEQAYLLGTKQAVKVVVK